MKDFFEWLGVNEKVAKVVIWIFVIMVMIISTNMLFESIGLPYYKITYDNLVTGTYSKAGSVILNCLVALLNFYCIIFLVFRVKEFKKIFKYSLLYLVLNVLVNTVFGYGVLQVFIAGYIVVFCYLYSNRNWKYALYGVIALIVDLVIQGLDYMYKVRFIDYSAVDGMTRFILSAGLFYHYRDNDNSKRNLLREKEEREMWGGGAGSWFWFGQFDKEGKLAKKVAKKITSNAK